MEFNFRISSNASDIGSQASFSPNAPFNFQKDHIMQKAQPFGLSFQAGRPCCYQASQNQPPMLFLIYQTRPNRTPSISFKLVAEMCSIFLLQSLVLKFTSPVAPM